MTEGKRLPLSDLRRLARLLQDYEGGLFTRAAPGGRPVASGDSLVPCMLLEPFTVWPNTGEDPDATYGRYFSARAAQLAASSRRIQVLRQTPGRPENAPFKLAFHAGSLTADLTCDMTTEQLTAQLDTLHNLKDEYEIIGKGATLGPVEEETEFTGKQWHIRFSERFDDGDLLGLDQTADNARLFVDFLWPTSTIRRVFYGLPGTPTDLSPGAFFWAQSLPGFGWIALHGECYHV